MTLTTNKTREVIVSIPEQIIDDLIICAFEGGINYWADEIIEKDGVYTFIECPDGDEGIRRIFGKHLVKEGLTKMATDFPQHFANILLGDIDVETADVFIQCCVLGNIVYG